MKAPVAVTVLAVLLAGCAGDTVTPSPLAASPEASGPATFAVTSTKGAIEGLVLDSSIAPIAEASVSLRESASDGAELQNFTTGEDGRFGFELLEPGTYRVAAYHPGFGNGSALAIVEPEHATVVRLVVDPLPTVEPYTLLYIENGIISCGVAIVIVSAVCLPAQTQPVFGPFKVAIFYPIPTGHQAVVSETDWASRQQVMRQWFMHDETRDNNFEGDWLGDAIGPAVLRKEFRPGQLNGFTPASIERKPFPPSDQNFTFMSATYFDGLYQREINSTASAACRSNPILGYCSGVGVALQMKFTNYVSVFVNEAPESLAAYSAIPDQ